MYSYVHSAATHGVEGKSILVETDVSDGFPCFSMVGYLASEVKEANERVRTALRNSGYSLPTKRITVNLSPADVRKEGTAFDIAIAVSVLVANGVLKQTQVESKLMIGELGLNGEVRSVTGVLPVVQFAKNEGFSHCFVPYDNRQEAAMIKGIAVVGVRSLTELLQCLFDEAKLDQMTEPWNTGIMQEDIILSDLADLKGQDLMKRALEIAVSGMHNILLSGPPGSGKSMIAKCIPGIMPELSFDEKIEIMKIYSVSGQLKQGEVISKRPFRSPHNTITEKGLIGGGLVPKPGEISLAHKGVLFLDEMPEFGKNTIEVMRQPMEEHKVTISRLHGVYEYPANFMLAGAMNLCPCGCFPNYEQCQCSPNQIRQYQNRISQAILDRIDIHVSVSPITYEELQDKKQRESSREVRERVLRTQIIQKERYREFPILFNSELENKDVKELARMTKGGEAVLADEFRRGTLSARGYLKTCRVARTIADMEEEQDVLERHVMEAISYRSFHSDK